MSKQVSNFLQLIEWGVASRAMEKEAESGDLHLVQPRPEGVLVAVVDGLGHGQEAAAAARIAITELAESARGSLISLMTRCHQKLVGTRGVVMTLASINELEDSMPTLTWLGVGNVEGLVLRADPKGVPGVEGVLSRGGVVGYQLPMLQASVVPIRRGDTLVLATDGIRSGFVEGLALSDPPQKMADRILDRHGKDTDDALALVVRYLGRVP